MSAPAAVPNAKAGTIVLVGCGQMGSAMLRGGLRAMPQSVFPRHRAGRDAGDLMPNRKRSGGAVGPRMCRWRQPRMLSSSP